MTLMMPGCCVNEATKLVVQRKSFTVAVCNKNPSCENCHELTKTINY